jgi:hypothetical protein
VTPCLPVRNRSARDAGLPALSGRGQRRAFRLANRWAETLPGAGLGKVEVAGARALGKGDAEPLGQNVIHSATNPIPRLTGAIHVYGGDFFAAERSEWDAETLLEHRYNA